MIFTSSSLARAHRFLAGCAFLAIFASTSLTPQMRRDRGRCAPSAIGTQFADVIGDHRPAAIAINQNGVAVRRSDGRRFERTEIWVPQAYFGSAGSSQNIYFADVNGDGRADAIVSNPTEIAVRLSDGSQFVQHDLWIREG